MKHITDHRRLSKVLDGCQPGVYPQWSIKLPGLLYLRQDGVVYYFPLRTFEMAVSSMIERWMTEEGEKKFEVEKVHYHRRISWWPGL